MLDDHDGYFAAAPPPAGGPPTTGTPGRRSAGPVPHRGRAGTLRALAPVVRLLSVVLVLGMARSVAVEVLRPPEPAIVGALEADPTAAWDVLAVYAVEERTLARPRIRSLHPLAQDTALHALAWDAWLEVAPAAWAHRIDAFVVATDGPDGIAGAMWAAGDERALIIDPASSGRTREDLISTMLHELAHLVVRQDGEPSRLDAGELPVTPLGPSCRGRPLVVKCADEGSLLGRYAAAFWSDDALAAAAAAARAADPDAAVVALYLDRPSSYVSPYAATNPDEDIAETVVAIVLGPEPRAGTVAAAKADWLRAQPAIADLIIDLTGLG